MPSHFDFPARAPQRRCPPFFRLPTTSHLLAWLLASTLAAPALAQPAQGSNTPAPLHYTPLPLQSPQAPAEVDWAAANRAVAEFPRGHADIVHWEARNATATPTPPHSQNPGPQPMPAGHHHPAHQGARP